VNFVSGENISHTRVGITVVRMEILQHIVGRGISKVSKTGRGNVQGNYPGECSFPAKKSALGGHSFHCFRSWGT